MTITCPNIHSKIAIHAVSECSVIGMNLRDSDRRRVNVRRFIPSAEDSPRERRKPSRPRRFRVHHYSTTQRKNHCPLVWTNTLAALWRQGMPGKQAAATACAELLAKYCEAGDDIEIPGIPGLSTIVSPADADSARCVHRDASYAYLERLGVADDLGLPMHPGSPAWAIAVGEALALMRPNDTSMTSTHSPRPGSVVGAEAHTHFRHDAGEGQFP